MKHQKNFRLETDTIKHLDRLSKELDKDQTTIVEMAIFQMRSSKEAYFITITEAFTIATSLPGEIFNNSELIAVFNKTPIGIHKDHKTILDFVPPGTIIFKKDNSGSLIIDTIKTI